MIEQDLFDTSDGSIKVPVLSQLYKKAAAGASAELAKQRRSFNQQWRNWAMNNHEFVESGFPDDHAQYPGMSYWEAKDKFIEGLIDSTLTTLQTAGARFRRGNE